MSERLVVDAPAQLRAFLRRMLPDWKRSTLEQRIRAGCVRVNGAIVSRPEAVLAAGDEVVVGRADEGMVEAEEPAHMPAGIVVLYTDEDVIAIDKPAGLLSVASEREHERTALALVRASLSRRADAAELWPVHRLDRETSGVLLFAKTRAARATLQEKWDAARKLYLAIVEGVPAPPSGVIDQPLFEDQNLHVRVGARPEAKLARTLYTTREVRGRRALLEVELESGRKHQIRAHLAWLGHPVVGDERYGNAGPRLGLHALRLVVPHPRDGRELVLEARAPREFLALLRPRGK